MKIRIVTVRSGWILQKIAERIAANRFDNIEFEVGHEPIFGGYNFYVDMQNCFCYKRKVGKIDIGFFTHIHENDWKNTPAHYSALDYIYHMSIRSYEEFLRHGYSPLKMKFKMPGEIDTSIFKYKRPTIGIIQRGKYEGKGFNLLLELVENNLFDIVNEYKWLFIGDGWEDVASKLASKNALFELHSDNIKWPDDYAALYDKIDYLLIPSKWEGGPMSLLEACATGKQIIAPDVGWINKEIEVDFHFNNGQPDSLASTLLNIVDKRISARDLAEKLSYKDYALDLARKFCSLGAE